jgi:hypothetical protein
MKPKKKDLGMTIGVDNYAQFEKGYNQALSDIDAWLGSEECQDKIFEVIDDWYANDKGSCGDTINRKELAQAILSALKGE